MTILTAVGNGLAILPEQELYLALFHGIRRVAIDCGGEAPARQSSALASRSSSAALKRWLRGWAAVRHREAAERTVHTAIAIGAPPTVLAELLIAAETDCVFADSGHSLDFINKSFGCLDLIGWQHAADMLPSVVGQMVAARGADELTEWRQPVDLVALCSNASADLAAAFAAGRDRGPWLEHTRLAQNFLGDDPGTIIAALEFAASEGASCTDQGVGLSCRFEPRERFAERTLDIEQRRLIALLGRAHLCGRRLLLRSLPAPRQWNVETDRGRDPRRAVVPARHHSRTSSGGRANSIVMSSRKKGCGAPTTSQENARPAPPTRARAPPSRCSPAPQAGALRHRRFSLAQP